MNRVCEVVPWYSIKTLGSALDQLYTFGMIN